MIKIGKREITVFLLCIVIGILLVIQIRADNSGNMYVSASEIDDYIAQIESERANIDAIKEQIEESKRQLADYEESAKEKDNATIQAKLTSELESFRSMSCADAVRGSGVKIVVDDGTRPLYEGEDINDIIVHDIDILLIVNELKRCKAEAIAVNGHRITPYTSIVCSGYTIRMDGMVYARPFEITAIGDAKRMSGALLAPEGYGTYLREWGVLFTIESVENVEIPAYSEEESFKYAEPAN